MERLRLPEKPSTLERSGAQYYAMVAKLPHEENAARTFPKKMTLGRKMGRDPPYVLFYISETQKKRQNKLLYSGNERTKSAKQK